MLGPAAATMMSRSAAVSLILHGRTGHVAEGAEYAAVAGSWLNAGVAGRAVVEVDACVGRHQLLRCSSAMRALDDCDQLHPKTSVQAELNISSRAEHNVVSACCRARYCEPTARRLVLVRARPFLHREQTMIRRTLAFAATLLAVAGPATAQETTATIRFRVFTQDSTPVEGARLISGAARTSTDAHGAGVLHVHPGSRTVVVSAFGYAEQTRRLETGRSGRHDAVCRAAAEGH